MNDYDATVLRSVASRLNARAPPPLIFPITEPAGGRGLDTTRIIRYKGQLIRDIVYLSEKLRDMTL